MSLSIYNRMELLKPNILCATKNEDKPAILLCSQNEVLKKVTYTEVCEFADNIKKFILKNVKKDNACIGLFMEKNVFIPSVILSFQELHYTFVFLTRQTLIKTTKILNIEWILSYEENPLGENFVLKDILQLSVKDELNLWRNSVYLENGKELNFKDIFCVVQTSGSTGENKIVRVPHSCIERNVLSLNKYFGLSDNHVIYWGTPLTFDPTLVEFLLGMFCHATLVIVPKLVSLNPTFLYDALFKVGCASFLQIVPSVFLRWNKQQIASLVWDSCLKILAFGGEQFAQEILQYRRRKELKIFNLYGVTELSCWATIANVSEFSNGNQVLLGKTLDETFIEFRNDNDEIVLNGIGEICIGSNTRCCLLNDNEINSTFPFMVKTGDLGELTNQGLVYRGRKTRIFKRFGHKVNLYKIEEIILKETNLQSRLVYSVHYNKLLAFILIEEYFNKNTKIRLLDKFRVKLLKIISETEFPDYIEVVTQFPLNEHGKICDKSLEILYENSLNKLEVEKFSPTQAFTNILSRHLKTELNNNLETLGKYSFFELGGNSILAVQFLSEFQEHTGGGTPGELVTLLFNESVESCLSYVENNMSLKRKLVEVGVEEKPKQLIIENRKQPNLVVWKYNLKGCVDSAPLVFVRRTKTYIASASFAHIFAILNENGDEYLKLTLPQEIDARSCVPDCGNFIFIGCCNGTMYCIDLSLKIVSWEYHTLDKITTKASLCQESRAIVFGSYDNFMYCLATENSTLLWKTKLLGCIRADPIYCENLNIIYAATIKGFSYALNEKDGSVIWTYQLDGPVFGTPCIINEYIIWPCVTGMLHCISLTGDPKCTKKISGNIFSSLTVYEDKFYFGSHDSKVYEVTVSNDDLEISNTIQLESEISSTPCVFKFENKVFFICVCNTGILYAVDSSSGIIVFRYQLPDQSFSSPCVHKNKLYIGCRDNNLYCIDIGKALIN